MNDLAVTMPRGWGLSIASHVPTAEADTRKLSELDHLTAIYRSYCAAHGLELISADEQLLQQNEAGNHERSDWLRAFCALWERVEEDASEANA